MLEKLSRGEIWPLPGGGTADEIVSVAREMRMDFCFFDHWPGAPDKAHAAGLSAGAVVNGPWQRWMIEVGWEEAMLQLGRGTDGLRQGLATAAAMARREIEEWADTGVEMVLLAGAPESVTVMWTATHISGRSHRTSFSVPGKRA